MARSTSATRSILACSFVSLLLLLGCEAKKTAPPSVTAESAPADRKPEPSDPHGVAKGESPHAPKSGGPSGQQGASLPPVEITWTKPDAWTDKPKSPMRKASYEVPGDAGPAEVAVFYFGPGQGGGVEANIARWVGQFQGIAPEDARRDQMEVGGLHVYTVRVERGTFASGMPGGPTKSEENWGMNAAIVETPSGSYYFKMTGPEKTVTAEEGRFLELIKSVKAKS